jgi:hypothetical protein
MAASIAKLAAIATLNTDNFVQNVDKMQKKLQSFKRYQQAQEKEAGKYGMFGSVVDVGKDMKAVGRVMKVFGAAEAAISSARFITKAWQGDIEGATKLIEEMPFGIGKLISGVRTLREEWGLMPAYVYETKDALKEIEEQNKKIEAATKSAKTGNALAQRFSASGRAGQVEWLAGGMSDDKAAIYKEEYASAERLRAIDEEYAAWKVANLSATADTMKRVEAAYLQAREGEMYASGGRIRKIRQDQATKELEDQKRAAEEARRLAEQAAKDEYRRSLDRWRIQGDIAVEAIRASGKDVDAQRGENLLNYQAQIGEAERAGDTQMVELLKKRMAQTDASILTGSKGGVGSAVQFDPRFQARGAMATSAPPKLDPEAKQYLKEMADALKRYGLPVAS